MKISNEGRLVGILGTVIIHLIAGIIFMSFKLGSLKKNYSSEFEIELVPVDIPEVKKIPSQQQVTSIEKILQGDEELLNIARNLASKSDAKINPSDYIDKVKDELIKSGKLGVDNYIDEQKRLKETEADEKAAFENRTKINKQAVDNPEESQEMAANYKGPTRIYYNLSGRNHIYLPLPIYKCQGSGKVTLFIEVNRGGVVEKANIISNQSTTSDPCLIEAALNSAYLSKFNTVINSPKIQDGTLSYLFVAQ